MRLSFDKLRMTKGRDAVIVSLSNQRRIRAVAEMRLSFDKLRMTKGRDAVMVSLSPEAHPGRR